MKKIKLLTGLVGVAGLSAGLVPFITGCSCNAAQLVSIKVTTKPTKTTYTEGDKLDLSGMVVTATYSDKSTKIIDKYSTSPSTSQALTTSDTKVTVAYEGKTDEFAITVEEAAIELTYNSEKGTYYKAGSYPAGSYVCKVKVVETFTNVKRLVVNDSTTGSYECKIDQNIKVTKNGEQVTAIVDEGSSGSQYIAIDGSVSFTDGDTVMFYFTVLSTTTGGTGNEILIEA